MRNRIIFGLVLLGTIFYTPWWLVGLVALMGSFLFAPFYEIIAFGFLVDILMGAGSMPFGGTYGLVASIAIFFAGLYMRKIVR